jgi:hypothetical protein
MEGQPKPNDSTATLTKIDCAKLQQDQVRHMYVPFQP